MICRAVDADDRCALLRESDRLVAATDWLANESDTGGLPVGLFGASTGGGAALSGLLSMGLAGNTDRAFGFRPTTVNYGMTLFAFGAVSPWLSLVDHDKYGRYIDTVQKLDITTIAGLAPTAPTGTGRWPTARSPRSARPSGCLQSPAPAASTSSPEIAAAPGAGHRRDRAHDPRTDRPASRTMRRRPTTSRATHRACAPRARGSRR